MERDWSWSSAGCFVWQQKDGNDDPRWGQQHQQTEVEPTAELWSSASSSSGGYRAAVDRWSKHVDYRQVELDPIVRTDGHYSSLDYSTSRQINPPPTQFPPSPLSFRRESSPSLRRWKQFKHAGRNWRRRLYSR